MNSKRYRYATFSLLYFAQGSILGYFTALNALYLRSFDISMGQIGIFSAIALIPLILKIFIGMFSDRINLFGLGHRRPFIVLGLLIQAAGQLVFPLIDPVNHFVLLTIVAFLSLTGMAMYDTCTDGLAIDTTGPADEGTVQGIMVAGRALGIVLISAAVGILSEWVSWNAVFMMLAVMTIIPLPFALFLKEPPRKPDMAFSWSAFRAMGRKPIIALGLLGVIGFVVASGTNQLINPFLKEAFGISYIMAGFYAAIWGIGVIAGGISGGRLTDKMGHRWAVKTSLVASMITVFFLALIMNPVFAWPLVFLFGLAYGYFETVFFASSMGKTDLRIAASMFAILMAVANIGSGIGLAGGGFLSEYIGFRLTFVVFALLNLAALPLLPVIFRKTREPENQ